MHACQAGYIHTDNDRYVQDIAKVPCTRDRPGESNGNERIFYLFIKCMFVFVFHTRFCLSFQYAHGVVRETCCYLTLCCCP